MEKIITELCDSLTDIGRNNMQDVLMRVAFAFENYRGLPNDAWPDDIKYISITEKDAFYLKEKLEVFIKSKPDDVLLGTSVWSFGKIASKNDKDFLDELLRKNLFGNSETLYQIMCALGNIGVRLFDGGGSSMFDIEENIESAKKYLAAK